ncbi:hypothetical protein [Nonomuraea longicatena]
MTALMREYAVRLPQDVNLLSAVQDFLLPLVAGLGVQAPVASGDVVRGDGSGHRDGREVSGGGEGADDVG